MEEEMNIAILHLKMEAIETCLATKKDYEITIQRTRIPDTSRESGR
jgi:hypothetical protein